MSNIQTILTFNKNLLYARIFLSVNKENFTYFKQSGNTFACLTRGPKVGQLLIKQFISSKSSSTHFYPAFHILPFLVYKFCLQISFDYLQVVAPLPASQPGTTNVIFTHVCLRTRQKSFLTASGTLNCMLQWSELNQMPM